MEESLDHISPILPGDFFSATIDLLEVERWNEPLKKKYLLPEFSDLLYEDNFAQVSMGFHQKGLIFNIEINQPFAECHFPDIQKGDSIELFIDTRDLKSAGFITRFCHHFAILPKAMDGIQAKELTSFRTDDRHELCDEAAIEVEADFQKRSYFLKILIPSECLHGYDPSSFQRLGFAYRINRFGGRAQHFTVSSDYLGIEKEPSLWSSMVMVEA